MEIKLLPSAGRVTGWRMQLSFKGHSFPSVDVLNMVFSHDFGGGGMLSKYSSPLQNDYKSSTSAFMKLYLGGFQIYICS